MAHIKAGPKTVAEIERAKLKASLAQAQTDLLDAQVALTEEKASNSQRLSDLEEVVATLGGAK